MLTDLTEKTDYTYNVYATATIEGELVQSEPAVVTFRTRALNAVDLVYSDILNAEVAISHYLAYDGNDEKVDVRTPYTKWGMEKEAPVLGEPVSLELTASSEYAVLGQPIYLNASSG